MQQTRCTPCFIHSGVAAKQKPTSVHSVQGASVPPKPTAPESEATSASVQSSRPAAVTTREPAQADILIELKNVYKSFGSKPILRGANITIRRGEAVGIIGGSGTGKSTTLRIMAGLLMPDVV